MTNDMSRIASHALETVPLLGERSRFNCKAAWQTRATSPAQTLCAPTARKGTK